MENNTNKNGQNTAKILTYALIGIVVLAVIAAGLAIYFTISRGYVATVGNEKVSVAEFKFFLKQAKDAMLAEAGITPGTPEAETFWKTTKLDGEDPAEVAKKKTLESVKEFKIQVIKAKEKKISLDKADIDDLESRIDQVVQQNGNSRSAADKQFIEAYGVNLDEFKGIFKDYMLREKLWEDMSSGINIDDTELKKFYEENISNYERVTVTHVLFSTIDEATGQPFDEEKKKEARQKAEDILKQVKAGSDIKALAKQYSEDPGVTQNEGEYTFTKTDSYVQEFKDWAFKANVGDSDIVETMYGYHVMKLGNKATIPFDEAKDSVKQSAMNVKLLEQIDQWKKDTKYNPAINNPVYNSIK